ncbi:hypothetical protein EMPS_03315 [Entomortierella parvispora]|uniref:Fork-head domain-containing protein n=1 Tax=Entomortierella parvispora TaxID=205924 RepID=A0A9P3H6D6_9FUNG|nr:hypothetical protein EMPS_03315 [Entomortierella parvispora]
MSSSSSPTATTSPQLSKRKPRRSEKPNESWFLILVNAFKSNFEETLTYRESELYNWIMQAYPYYRHDTHTMQTSVKTTLNSYECFRQNGRSTWTFIPRRALVHLESLKSEEGRRDSEGSGDEEDEDMEEDDDEEEQSQVLDHTHTGGHEGTRYTHHPSYDQQDHQPQDTAGTRIRYIDRHLDLLDADSPTLSAEEIQRFKQEHSGAQSRKLKRKASGAHASRPRTRSPPASLQDECSMSMEAWCNLLVQMFEASPKQKTIREIYAWVHDNYPIYQNAPGDAWQADLTAALESNPLFRAMGRGRWQMATQPVQPVVVVNGSAASGSNNPSVKAEDDNATDSPSVTEDEDWKAIGSKRLLNFSFRRYSIATDTFPKNHYKVGSTMPANSNLQSQPPTSISTSSATIATASSSAVNPLTATTSGGMLLSTPYSNTGRRFSSYHQPTPKNSPPLSATTVGLPSIEEFGSRLRNALSEETDDEDDPAKRYMAPLQSAITSAVFALQSESGQLKKEPDQDQKATLTTTASHSPRHHPHHHHNDNYDHSRQDDQRRPPIVVHETGSSSSHPPYPAQYQHHAPPPQNYLSSASGHPLHNQEAGKDMPPETGASATTVVPAARVEPEIVIPNGEDLASDQMDAIQALALLCGGGV